MPTFRYTYGEGSEFAGSLTGCEAANARKDVLLAGPFVECCVRACWSDNCPSDWDLWLRERTEPGTGPGSSTKWVSYLNLGPVGESGMEMISDQAKEGETGNEVCGASNACGVVAGTNGFAGEIACFCINCDMTFPKTFDVAMNLFGADQLSCPDPLGTVCIEYSCCDDEDCGETFTETIVGAFDFLGKGTAGNEGAGDFLLPTIIVEGCTCSEKFTGSTSTCWVLSGRQSDGRSFVNRGGGRAPDKFIIPDDVNPDTCVLIEDGAEIPRRYYSILHDSVAAKMGVPRSEVIKGEKCNSKTRRGKGNKKPCRRCKKRKKKSLF